MKPVDCIISNVLSEGNVMELDEVFKSLSNPTRRAILSWLKEPDLHFRDYIPLQLYDFSVYGVCASFIQDKAGLSQPATSLCLKALQDMDFVIATKVGRWTYYKRNDERLAEVMSLLTTELSTVLQTDLSP